MEGQDLSKLKIAKPVGRAGLKRRRKGVWAAIIIAVAVIAALALSGVLSPSVEVRASIVSLAYPSEELTLLNASGYVVAQRKAAVASKTTGRLVWIGVEEGSKVAKGEVIARLENEDVEAAKSEAAANLGVAERGLDQAKAELKDASLNFERNKTLLAEGIVSKSEYDASEARFRKAQAAVESAKASIKAASAGLRAADVSVEYTLIRAPFDAVVLTKNADIGDIITPLGAAANAKAAVVTIADMGSLQVEADVSESNIGKVSLRQPCEIELDALPEVRFKGEVHMIVPTADRAKASVLVKVAFMEKDPRILPEMSAKVAFLSRELKDDERAPRLVVDPSAIAAVEGRNNVFVIRDDGTVAETEVSLGEKMGATVEVKGGLKAGEKVVLAPSRRLKDGTKVKVLEK
ncbi:MAG: efflux RND transporter periplasmic adaptor subunit [Deltaproteobacteria bacterium]|nr:efflux RND transporter periplasmic adaptor subunit [Deltaproteobacteria bacterium]